ncbi:MAG: HlyD family efflux transporter periplasmic adaptor subunit [Ruminococcaceae bacterium]|nr:HlyD family efflux transporter periplasmic adaptor subunit [Oscillospiraceae bacterium]
MKEKLIAMKDKFLQMPLVDKSVQKVKKIDFKNKKTRKIIIIVAVLLIALIAFLVYKGISNKAKQASAVRLSTSVAQIGELKVTITGSGVMEAMDKYDIVPLVRGNITSAPFEEGQIVEKDALLYTFDDSDAQISIQKAQNSITKAEITRRSNQETLDDWVSRASVGGHISGLDLKVGDSVNANTKVCTVTNDDAMKVEVPFAASVIDDIYIGAPAQLTSADYMTSGIYGTITDIDYSPVRSSDGTVMYYVEIEFENPGAITEGMRFTASVNGIMCSAGAGATASDTETLYTKSSGKVIAIYHKNGDVVSAGEAIVEISNSSTLDSLERSDIEYSDLLLSLDSQFEALDDYTLTSPITGTVIKKDYKEGDTVGTGTNSTVLATIADMSKMKFTMDVDELDISKIEIGQSVEVVADALEEKVFIGHITQIIQEGQSQSGVTTYPVQVVIDEPEGLMIGMNVTATVVVENKADALKVPVDAVTMVSGKAYVQKLKADKQPKSVKKEDASASQIQRPTDKMPTDQMPNGERPTGQMPTGQMPTGERPTSSAMQNRNNLRNNAEQNYTMEDFERVEVTIGISNEDEIEILSGLSEGDIVYVSVTSSNASSATNMMGGMGSMMGGMGGGMPAGMGGGMPAGMGGGSMRR